MQKYIIQKINSDGYERFAKIRSIENDINLNVQFLELDEYSENCVESVKRKTGDILTGNLSVDLVTESKKTDKEVMYSQSIAESPHIEAVVKVCETVDNYSLYAISSFSSDKILIELEKEAYYNIGDVIYIVGELVLKLNE